MWEEHQDLFPSTVSNLSSTILSLNSRISQHFKFPTVSPRFCFRDQIMHPSLPLKSISIGNSRFLFLEWNPSDLNPHDCTPKIHPKRPIALWTWGKKTKQFLLDFYTPSTFFLHFSKHPTFQSSTSGYGVFTLRAVAGFFHIPSLKTSALGAIHQRRKYHSLFYTLKEMLKAVGEVGPWPYF